MSTVEEKHGLWGQKDLNKFLHILAGNLGQVLETFRVSASSIEWDNTITIRVVARVTEIIYVKGHPASSIFRRGQCLPLLLVPTQASGARGKGALKRFGGE